MRVRLEHESLCERILMADPLLEAQHPRKLLYAYRRPSVPSLSSQ